MSKPEGASTIAGERLHFSTDALPPELDEQTRFRAFRELHAAVSGPDDIARAEDRPFRFQVAGVRYGELSLVRFVSTVTRMTRNGAQAAAAERDEMILGLNLGASPVQFGQRRREAHVRRGNTVLGSARDAADIRLAPDTPYQLLYMPKDKLLARVAHAEDLVARPFSDAPALRHLRRYCTFLLAAAEAEQDPELAAHVTNTLLDLAALCLGAEGETAEIARMRGLRAARLQTVLSEMRTGFAEPSFSAAHAAARLGLSERYVQDLLQETGRTFSDRVLELRLQRARAILQDPAHDSLRIGDLAYACGFNEVSYFNRCFRRRFGASPTQFRR